MDNKKRILWFCTVLIIFINIKVLGEFASGLHENQSVIIQREPNSLCGYDSVYVLLRIFNKDFNTRELREMIHSKDGRYSSLENLKRIIDNSGLYSLAVKGQRWHTLLLDPIGIGYRGIPDEQIGDFYLFKKCEEKILLFLPPDRVYTIKTDEFITRSNRGYALLVFKNRWEKYWAFTKLFISHPTFIISLAGAVLAVICVGYMVFKFQNDKNKKVRVVYAGIASLAGYLALLYICGHYYKSPVMSDSLVVLAHKKKIDMGCGNKGEKKNFEFSVRNVGKKPIVINKVFASCSCLSFDSQERAVNPNDTYTIKGTYKYPESGELNAYIYLFYNGGNSAEKVLISGRNCKMATIDKQRLYFGRIQKNTCIKKNIMLRCFIDKEGYFPRLKQLRSSSAHWLIATAEEIEERDLEGFKSYKITISVSGDIAPLGVFEERIYISLDDPDAKRTEIEVYGDIISPQSSEHLFPGLLLVAPVR